MRSEHLQYWLAEATRDELQEMENWDWVVDILQTDFGGVIIPTECTCHMMVLIHKGNGEFICIGIIKLLCKAFSGVINQWIGVAVQFHDVMHGFLSDRGTGTASPESKLLHHMMEISEDVLYEVFLNPLKAYDALVREQCMDILVGYGVGPRMESILWHYWDHLSMVARAGRYYVTPFKGRLGVTHGYPIYPTIFNMVVCLVIRHWFLMVAKEDTGPGGFGWVVQWLVAFFYTQAGPDPIGAGYPDGIVVGTVCQL